MRGSCPETSPMISLPASATLTRIFQKPRCFSATSREKIWYDTIDSKTESDDPGQYPLYWLPGLYGGVQVVERPARRPHQFLRRRRLSEPARSRRQQLHPHYL